MFDGTIRERVAALRPIDDTLMRKLLEDKEVCQEFLRVILDKPELQVVRVIPQATLSNLQGRSVILDALCTVSGNQRVNIEVQKADDLNHFKRVRYNASMVTVNCTPSGTEFDDVCDVVVVYITVKDIFQRGRNIYHVRSVVQETGDIVNDGWEAVYVNTFVNDGTKLSELMKCLMQVRVDNSNFPQLTKMVRYFKEDKEGVSEMCQIVEEYAQEVAQREIMLVAEKNARRFFVNGVSYEVVRDSITEVSPKRLREILDEVVKTKEEGTLS